MDKKFAVFDIDGTVLRWQFYHAIVHELIKQGAIPKEVGKSINDARMTWKQRAHTDAFQAYEAVLYKAYTTALTTLSVADFTTAMDKVFEVYKDQVYIYTRDLITELKAQGYILFAISGSHQEIVTKFGNYYGFDTTVGTEYLQNDGVFTGEEVTIVNRKDKALQDLVAKHDVSWQGSIGVGDSKSDIPMLKLVQQPIAFNPNKDLFTAAQQNGWKIVIERKNMIYELEQHNGTYLLA